MIANYIKLFSTEVTRQSTEEELRYLEVKALAKIADSLDKIATALELMR